MRRMFLFLAVLVGVAMASCSKSNDNASSDPNGGKKANLVVTVESQGIALESVYLVHSAVPFNDPYAKPDYTQVTGKTLTMDASDFIGKSIYLTLKTNYGVSLSQEASVNIKEGNNAITLTGVNTNTSAAITVSEDSKPVAGDVVYALTKDQEIQLSNIGYKDKEFVASMLRSEQVFQDGVKTATTNGQGLAYFKNLEATEYSFVVLREKKYYSETIKLKEKWITEAKISVNITKVVKIKLVDKFLRAQSPVFAIKKSAFGNIADTDLVKKVNENGNDFIQNLYNKINDKTVSTEVNINSEGYAIFDTLRSGERYLFIAQGGTNAKFKGTILIVNGREQSATIEF